MSQGGDFDDFRDNAQKLHSNASSHTCLLLLLHPTDSLQDGIALANRFQTFLQRLHAAKFTTNEYSHEIGPLPAEKQGRLFGAQEEWEGGARKYRSLEFERALVEKLNYNEILEVLDGNVEGVRNYRCKDKKELFSKDWQNTCKAILWDVDLFVWEEPPAGQEPE
jgi:hypothetical protein